MNRFRIASLLVLPCALVSASAVAHAGDSFLDDGDAVAFPTTKLLLFLGWAVICSVIFFVGMFRSMLKHDRPPRESLGMSAGLWWIALGLMFAVLFLSVGGVVVTASVSAVLAGIGLATMKFFKSEARDAR